MSEGVTFAIARGVILAVDLWRTRVRQLGVALGNSTAGPAMPFDAHAAFMGRDRGLCIIGSMVWHSCVPLDPRHVLALTALCIVHS